MAGYSNFKNLTEDDFNLWRMSPANDIINTPSTSNRRVDFTTNFTENRTPQTTNLSIPETNKKGVGNDNDEVSSKLIASVTGITNLLMENIISHPFVVLRRQCQVK